MSVSFLSTDQIDAKLERLASSYGVKKSEAIRMAIACMPDRTQLELEAAMITGVSDNLEELRRHTGRMSAALVALAFALKESNALTADHTATLNSIHPMKQLDLLDNMSATFGEYAQTRLERIGK